MVARCDSSMQLAGTGVAIWAPTGNIMSGENHAFENKGIVLGLSIRSTLLGGSVRPRQLQNEEQLPLVAEKICSQDSSGLLGYRFQFAALLQEVQELW